MKKIGLAIATWFLLVSSVNFFFIEGMADQSNLIIYYFHRPPYYIKTDNLPKGFIMAFVRKVIEKSGIGVTFEEMPPKRILEELKKPRRACSPGWFKTPDREKLYLFSAPIYRDAPMTFIMARSKDEKFQKITVEETVAFIRSSQKPGIICGFSYGPYLDALFSREQISRCVTTSVLNVLKMVSIGRLDLTIMFSEEFGYIAANHPELLSMLSVISVEGSHAGSRRYLMCSKGIEKELFERINKNITELVDWLE